MTDALIEKMVEDADAIARKFIGVEEQSMLATLYDIRETLKDELDQMFGIDISTAIAEAFVYAVSQRKIELERLN
jgi:hypothetical protein